MSDEQQIPPQSEWKNLSTSQLFDLRTTLLNKYYDLKRINASFADQFLTFSKNVDVLLERQEQIRLLEQQEARQ